MSIITKRKIKLVAKALALLTILVVHTSYKEVSHDTDGEDSIWFDNYRAALDSSEAENKPLLIYFSGSDWCKPCVVLEKEVFHTDTFEDYAKENLILLRADFPRYMKTKLSAEVVAHHKKLANKYNKKNIFPLVVIVSSKEKVLLESGYRKNTAQEYVTYLSNNI